MRLVSCAENEQHVSDTIELRHAIGDVTKLVHLAIESFDKSITCEIAVGIGIDTCPLCLAPDPVDSEHLCGGLRAAYVGVSEVAAARLRAAKHPVLELTLFPFPVWVRISVGDECSGAESDNLEST
jgi:hypothetical protein